MMINNGIDPSAMYGINASRTEASNNIGKMASGSRINQAADDAAGLAVSESLRSMTTGTDRASQNAQSGVSLIQTADSALGNMSEVLSRMQELAVQATNGTYSDEDRALLNKEFTQLKDSLDQIASSTNYNGKNLLDGSISGQNGISIQTGTDGADSTRVNIGIGDMSSDGLGLKDINIGSPEGAASAFDAISNAAKTVSDTRGSLGAVQNSLESTVNNLENSRENTAASESRIRDLDMAQEAMEHAKQSIQEQASQSVMLHGMNLIRQNAVALLK